MRRPLFTTGIPQIPPAIADIIVAPETALSVLDLRSLTEELQSYTRFVTLYALNQSELTADVISVALRTGSDTPVLLMSAFLPLGIGTGGPIKILDRFPLRGNVELLVSNFTGDAAPVWGYFELDGSLGLDPTTRPLMAEALVSPFNYAPAIATGAAGDTQVHLFSTDYYDQVILDASVTVDGAFTSTVRVDDGIDSVLLAIQGFGDGNGSYPTRLFDGIPMMAGANAGTPGISITTNDASSETRAWGSFIRVT